jgi:hypothetical protein
MTTDEAEVLVDATREALIEKLPRCPTCTTPQLARAPCLHCRAMEAEMRLASISFFGDDDWMRKVAQLEVEALKSGERLHPLGFFQDFSSSPSSQFTFNVVSRPQIPFKPVYLTIAPECAGMGTILDIKIGNRSQFIEATPYPMSIFSPQHWGSMDAMLEVMGQLSFDTAAIAQDITICVDVSLQKYDPLTQVALDHLGLATPTAFKAVMWGRSTMAMMPMPDYVMPPAPQLYMAGIGNVAEVEATLRFADVLKKLRGER